MGSTEEQYHLRWNDYHSSLTKCFRDLRDNEEMLDVTIISGGETFKAHKLVLSACSPMFKTMLQKTKTHPVVQPIVFLHGVRNCDIAAILDFMYNGEVSINQEDLRPFLAVAEDLRVRGLTEMELDQRPAENEESEPEETSRRERSRSPSYNRIRRPSSKDVITEAESSKRPVLNAMEINLDQYHLTSSSSHSSPYDRGAIDQRRSSLTPSDQCGPSNGEASFHRLGGRDIRDRLSHIMVAQTEHGWHCPDCIHIATTKGNLKSHILSGRHRHIAADKTYKCRFCDRSYSTRQSMQVHISTNHREERDFAMTSVSMHQNTTESGGDEISLQDQPTFSHNLKIEQTQISSSSSNSSRRNLPYYNNETSANNFQNQESSKKDEPNYHPQQ